MSLDVMSTCMDLIEVYVDCGAGAFVWAEYER